MLYDLLHHWPLELITFWLFPLFFAWKFVHLGLIGFCGRGIPISSSRRRWTGPPNRIFSVALIVAGVVICAAFAYWLCVAIFQRWWVA
jgi:hypothetical protein